MTTLMNSRLGRTASDHATEAEPGASGLGGSDRTTTAYRSDPALIDACLRGDKGAWETVVDRYKRLVYTIAHRCGLREADAEDVFQDVFLILFKNLEKLRDKSRLGAWLITITRRECWRLVRRSGRSCPLEACEHDLAARATHDEHRGEYQHLVRSALDRLGGRGQQVLEALFSGGPDGTYECAAMRLGIPVGSIGPTRSRSFMRLSKIFTELGFEPD